MTSAVDWTLKANLSNFLSIYLSISPSIYLYSACARFEIVKSPEVTLCD